jgi:hypothetical protein
MVRVVFERGEPVQCVCREAVRHPPVAGGAVP